MGCSVFYNRHLNAINVPQYKLLHDNLIWPVLACCIWLDKTYTPTLGETFSIIS